MSRKVLQERKPQLKIELKELIDYYGVKAPMSELYYYINTENLPDSVSNRTYLYLTKFTLQKLFSRYDRVIPEFNSLPPHSRVAIDVFGFRTVPQKTEITFLEMQIFFDMAILLNSSLELFDSLSVNDSKYYLHLKRLNALKRSTAKAAFNLIEAYLNGLALDIILTQNPSPKEKIKLSEWDESKNKKHFLSLRDKFLQYPKIALKLEHPPLSESNFEEMKGVLESEKELRHALIHPTPMIAKESTRDSREEFYFNLDINEVYKLCDNVVESIFKISSVLNNMFGDPALWLVRRDESGKFPENVFV